MARGYREVNRDQVFLLPPSLRDWLPEDHLVWFVADAVQRLDLTALHAKRKTGGVGRRGFDPAVLLAVWIYASARGMTSSRQIERACLEDIAFRVLCGNDGPDHSTLAEFRQQNRDTVADLFAQVLALCMRAGMGRLGIVSIDGTKITANASAAKTVSLDRLRQIAAAELAKAEATDAAEDAADAPTVHDEVPPMFRGPGRAARIKQALEELEEQVETESGTAIRAAEQRLAAAKERQAVIDAGVQAGTRRADTRRARDAAHGVEVATVKLDAARQARVDQEAGAHRRRTRYAKRNTTDVDSRIMKSRNGYVQAFNTQLAVADDGLILVAQTSNNPTDTGQFAALAEAAIAAVRVATEAAGRSDRIGFLVADNGYLTNDVLDLTLDGSPTVLIAPGGRTTGGVWAPGRTKAPAAATHMHSLLADPDNKAAYARRSATVEPRNADLKDRRGLRRLAGRGLEAAGAEVSFAAFVTNLLRLNKTGTAFA